MDIRYPPIELAIFFEGVMSHHQVLWEAMGALNPWGEITFRLL
jgi:hypothetical protein